MLRVSKAKLLKSLLMDISNLKQSTWIYRIQPQAQGLQTTVPMQKDIHIYAHICSAGLWNLGKKYAHYTELAFFVHFR